jgi:beta-glucosidase
MHRLFINYIVSHSDQRFGVVVCPGIDQPGNETLPFALYDKFRIDYFEKYLYELQCAIRDGANVFGYFAWSLLDNFEWRLGFTSKFGIVYVDRNTFVRYPKDSARWFRKVIKNEN